MTKSPRIMIITGELSGDMHAASLVHALKKRLPDAEFFGIGGDHMREAGVETLYDANDMAVTGFTEAIRRYRFLRRVFYELLEVAGTRRPDAVILVDYPGFNLRFAARTHAMGIRTIYYICPQVWAWNRARIPRMAKIVDRLIAIFPFEAQHFEGTGLQVDFAGHPLVDETRRARDAASVDLPWQGRPRVAILPGSRDHEIDMILPPMWDAAALVERKHPGTSFLLAAPSPRIAAILERKLATLDDGPSRYSVVVGDTRQVLRQADAAFVASGTATLEASLMRCPTVIAYKVSALTAIVARLVIKLPFVGIVNIIAGRGVCPELLQRDCTAPALADAIEPLLTDTPERRHMLDDLDSVNAALGEGGAEDRAAASVLEELEG